MDKKRLQKLAGVITENVISEGIPQNVMSQKFNYVGNILEFDPTEYLTFDTLNDFFAIVRWGWDKDEDEIEEYLNSLSYENGKIVSNYSGKKTVELIKQ
jgi:hypothetical protein